MKISVCSDITFPYGLMYKYWCYGGASCFHFHLLGLSWRWRHESSSKMLVRMDMWICMVSYPREITEISVITPVTDFLHL